MRQHNSGSPVILDQCSVESISEFKQKNADRLKYSWNHYAELARQRNEMMPELKRSLTESCISDYEFKKWQRAVKYKYSLHPLSTAGSFAWVGGRFNLGKEINADVAYFPALYVAQDKDTALQEHLGQQECKSKLSPRELALTNPNSETIVSVSGKVDKIFDLTNFKNLEKFATLTKKFIFSEELIKLATKLDLLSSTYILQNSQNILKSLLMPDWRTVPTHWDIPANSQIFGHLIYLAGIEGILYPSKLTRKKCLALFPRNFANTDSYIFLNDELPHETVPGRIDSQNWRIAELGPREILY